MRTECWGVQKQAPRHLREIYTVMSRELLNPGMLALMTFIWAVGFGLLAQVLAFRWRIPSIILLLVTGVILGPEVLGIVQPSSLGDGLSILVKLAVAIILFEGALNLRIGSLRHAALEVRNLVTIGVLTTWVLTTVAAYYVDNLSLSLSLIFGAIVTVTGPTVVQPLLRRIDVPRRIKTILEGEAILVDPIGAILAVAVADVVLGVFLRQEAGIVPALWGYLSRLLIGIAVGGIGGVALSRIMRTPRLISPELANLVALAGVWVVFGVSEMVQSESGIMASVVMGLVFQREVVPGQRQLRRFKETLTILCISILFVLLAANLDIRAVLSEGMPGFMTVLLIMFVVRPISVFLSTIHSGLKTREKIFISWVGPRGIVAASVASLFAFTLVSEGVAENGHLLALTFMTIAMTVTLQGLTVAPLARLLGLQNLHGRLVIIVGANLFGCAVAKIIREHGRPVVLVDTNNTFIDHARYLGFEAVHGNALEEEVLVQAGAEDAETMIAITSNSELNVLATQLGRNTFGITRSFPVLANPEKGAGMDLLKRTGGNLAFGRPIDIVAWEFLASRSALQTPWEVPAGWPAITISKLQLPEEVLPVVRIRNKSAEIVNAEQTWNPGDKIVFLASEKPEDSLYQIEDLAGLLKPEGDIH